MPGRNSWYEIKAKADDHAEILIYSEIGESWWTETVDAKTFVRELKDLDVSTIDVRINSPGGAVFDGQAIYNALRRHKATVTTYVDGLAASIASVIALAGDKVVMAKNAMMMIHDPFTWVAGDATELRKTADLLDKVKTTLVNVYTEKTGRDDAEIADAMTEESWYTADEAMDFGLADEIGDSVEVAALAHFDAKALAKFQHPPAQLVAALARNTTENSPPESTPENAQGAAGGGDTMPTNSERVERVTELLTAIPIH